MSKDDDFKKVVMMTPKIRLEEQIRFLDKALTTISYYGSEETKTVRSYIIAQIEALKWASKLSDV